MIIYNRITEREKIFGSDYNKISIVTKNEIKNYKRMTKVKCAREIINYAYNYKLANE